RLRARGLARGCGGPRRVLADPRDLLVERRAGRERDRARTRSGRASRPPGRAVRGGRRARGGRAPPRAPRGRTRGEARAAARTDHGPPGIGRGRDGRSTSGALHEPVSIARGWTASREGRRVGTMGLDRATFGSLAARLFGRDPAHALALVRSAWPLAVGPELARRTEVLALDGRVLRVRVPDAGWTRVLHRMRRDILVRLREVAGELAPSRIGVIEGGGPPPAATAEPPAAVGEPLMAPLVEEGAAAIADAELRDAFLRTARRYLARASRPASSLGEETSCET